MQQSPWNCLNIGTVPQSPCVKALDCRIVPIKKCCGPFGGVELGGRSLGYLRHDLTSACGTLVSSSRGEQFAVMSTHHDVGP